MKRSCYWALALKSGGLGADFITGKKRAEEKGEMITFDPIALHKAKEARNERRLKRLMDQATGNGKMSISKVAKINSKIAKAEPRLAADPPTPLVVGDVQSSEVARLLGGNHSPGVVLIDPQKPQAQSDAELLKLVQKNGGSFRLPPRAKK